ncbi:hypothetical protein AB0E96_04495 [Kitasatospora sp. NPDC036755]|uniref:hypothetical protein n=1 Tax=Kitasatospora sp. NPDC036755 TaxID=3154600 RepID=UPI0033D6BD47
MGASTEGAEGPFDTAVLVGLHQVGQLSAVDPAEFDDLRRRPTTSHDLLLHGHESAASVDEVHALGQELRVHVVHGKDADERQGEAGPGLGVPAGGEVRGFVALGAAGPPVSRSSLRRLRRTTRKARRWPQDDPGAPVDRGWSGPCRS